MDRSEREDPRLGEVKAVLQRLQGLSADPQSVGLRTADARSGRRAIRAILIVAGVAVVAAIAYAFPDLRQFAMSMGTGAGKPVGTPQKVAIEGPPSVDPPVANATALSHGAPVDAQIPKSPAGPASQLTDRAKSLEVAKGLMSSGRVLAARQQLLTMAAGGSSEVAWHLARSYDPNYLGTIPAADAGPNIQEAARWYRTWYAAAVEERSVAADKAALERIIGAMRQ